MKKTLLFAVTGLMVAALGCSMDKNSSGSDNGPAGKNLPYGSGQKPVVEKPEASADLEDQVIQNVAFNVILKTYKNLAGTANALHRAAIQLAATPTQSNLEKAQQAWRDTREPWESSESFLFGPVESLSVDPMIDTWPLNILDMDAILKGSRNIDRSFIGSLGNNVQGFHTIEYLLFGNGATSNVKTIDQMTQRELDYLVATTDLVAAHAKRLSDAWEFNENPDRPELLGYVVRVMNPGNKNNFYPSKTSVFAEYVNGMIGIADEVGNGKIADPFGADIDHADTTKVESPFSWNSITDFSNNIESIRAVFTGDYDNNDGKGIQDLVTAKNPALAQKTLNQIDLAIQKINQIGVDKNGNQMAFRQAILDVEGRQRVQAAVDALLVLKATLENEVLRLVTQ